MRRLLWDVDGATEGRSFVLRQWWRLFPLRHGSPGKFSTVDIVVDGRILEERLEFLRVVIGGVEESFECPDAGAFFLEELDNRISFPLVGGGSVRW